MPPFFPSPQPPEAHPGRPQNPGQDSVAQLPERVPEGGGAGDRHARPQEDHQGRDYYHREH